MVTFMMTALLYAGNTPIAQDNFEIKFKNYFNSDIAAKDLLKTYLNYIRYGKYAPFRKGVVAKYFVYRDDNFEDGDLIEVSEDKACSLNKSNSFFMTHIYKNNKIIEIYVHTVMKFYDHNHNLADIKYNKKNFIVNYDYMNSISCSKYLSLIKG